MIALNEVRIGNLIHLLGHRTEKFSTPRITKVNPDTFNEFVYGNFIFEGIPMTEKWLKDFGFKNPKHSSDDNSNHYMRNGLTFGCWNNGSTVIFTGILDGKTIRFVHDFQNLYYALTGSEIELSAS